MQVTGQTLDHLLVHSRRAQRYALALARAIDPTLLEDRSLGYGFILHDVGKIGIPDWILLKPASLTDEEREVMQTHTLLGEQLLAELAFLRGAGIRVVRSHHERWDGSGYPDGLAGSAVPLSVRIFAVADALDAMTSYRPYRRSRMWSEAVEEIVRGAGTQFDPEVVLVFTDLEPALRRIHLH